MSHMEKKMPLPSFSETFNMPSKILARFRDNPDLDNCDSSSLDIFPNNCSCCWATECFNSRVPSPIWNDINFRIVSELTGLTSRSPEREAFSSNALECVQYKEFEETSTDTIENAINVRSLEFMSSMNTRDKSSSEYDKQVNVADVSESHLSTKCCSVLTNERLSKHHSESSNKSLDYVGVPSSLQIPHERDKKECVVDVDSGGNGDLHLFSRNSSDSGNLIMVSNEVVKPPCDEKAFETGVSEVTVLPLQKRCRSDINEIDLLNYDSNQENKKEDSSGPKSLKNGNQLISEVMVKKDLKAMKEHAEAKKSDQPPKIINQFSCDNCQKTYKSKKTLSWHRSKNPECKPPMSVVKKKKSSKQNVHSITLKDEYIIKNSDTGIADLAAQKKVTSNKEKSKKPLMNTDERMKEPKEDLENIVRFQLPSVTNEKLDAGGENLCKELIVSFNSGDSGSKNFPWQCEFCVKCYKHKSSLQKHKKKYHLFK